MPPPSHTCSESVPAHTSNWGLSIPKIMATWATTRKTPTKAACQPSLWVEFMRRPTIPSDNRAMASSGTTPSR